MKDNNISNIDNSDIEDILKSKMNELSDSVDCFDRISEKVFSADEDCFFKDGYVVDGVEVVTSKPRISRIIKVTAAAAAVVAGIAVIPQTDLARQISTDLYSDVSVDNFMDIVSELEAELENCDYSVIDVPLQYYIKNDILVTPMLSCPFEACDVQDADVRIFTKQIDNIDTTQVYAVLYSGEYTTNNFIAAAESKYKFTAEEAMLYLDDKADSSDSADAVQEKYLLNHKAESIIEKHFFSDDNLGYLTDGNTPISAGSFVNTLLTKDKLGEMQVMSNEFIIWHSYNTNYFYDIVFGNENDSQLSREKIWKRSLYFNGNSSLPDSSESAFVRTDLINAIEADNDSPDFTFIFPYDDSTHYLTAFDDCFKVTTSPYSSYMTSIPIPVNAEALLTMKLYLPVSALDNEIIISYNGENHYWNETDVLTEAEQIEIIERRRDVIMQEHLILQQKMDAERQNYEKLRAAEEQADLIAD